MKPAVFIGSSVGKLDIAYAIQENLTHDAEVTVWDQDIFQLSSSTLDDLQNALDKFDFAILIFAPDDVIKIGEKEYLATRDNVIFELGLFIGRLGKQRCFLILPEDHNNFRIPTDLIGITPGTYDSHRSDRNLNAALGPTCNKIRKSIGKFGILNRNSTVTTSYSDQFEDSFFHIRIQRLITERKTEDEPKFTFNLRKKSFVTIATNLHEGLRSQIAGIATSGFDINNGFTSLCVLRSKEEVDTSNIAGTHSSIKDKFFEKLQNSKDVIDITSEIDITDLSQNSLAIK